MIFYPPHPPIGYKYDQDFGDKHHFGNSSENLKELDKKNFKPLLVHLSNQSSFRVPDLNQEINLSNLDDSTYNSTNIGNWSVDNKKTKHGVVSYETNIGISKSSEKGSLSI